MLHKVSVLRRLPLDSETCNPESVVIKAISIFSGEMPRQLTLEKLWDLGGLYYFAFGRA